MKRRIWTGLMIAGATGLLAWVFWPAPMDVEDAAAVRGRFEQALQADGRARLRQRYVVTAALSGRLDRIQLQPGDAVDRDTVLAQIRPASPALLDERTRLEQAERVGALEAALRRAQAQSARAQAALDQAGADLRRTESLARQGFVAPSQSEAARLAQKLRQQEQEAAVQEEHAARHELAQWRIALRQGASGGDHGRQPWLVRSPAPGQVIRVLRESEGVVSAGTPLLEVGDPSRMEIAADLLTEQAAQVRTGMPATLTGWGGAHTLSATVRQVEPAAFTKVSALGVEEQRVNVILDITSPPEQWRGLGDGYRLEVRIPVQAVDDALLVPVGAVFPDGSGWAVYAVEDGRARHRSVDLAGRNGRQAWLRSGLAAGSRVVVYPPAALRPGDRVRSAGRAAAPGAGASSAAPP